MNSNTMTGLEAREITGNPIFPRLGHAETPHIHPLLSSPAKSNLAEGRSAIEHDQLHKVQHLLSLLLDTNPFYKRKLVSAGLSAKLTSLAEFFQSTPFTTKQELIDDQQVYPPYGSNLTYPLTAYSRYHQTSGSAGAPLRWLDTPEDWGRLVGNWALIFNVAGTLSTDRFFFAFSFGPFLGFWSAYEAAVRSGCFCFPGGSMSSVARLQAILDNNITVLCCTPTYALHLGEVARAEQLDLSRGHVRLIIVAGEAGGSIPATRSRICSLWGGARVFDHHGMTEVGPVTYECAARPGVLHVLESAYLAEVIQPSTNQAVLPGQTGELVLTTLERLGSPVLRYRTGDLVKAPLAVPCICGRNEWAFEGGILGRSDDMVVVRGVNIFPSAVEDLVRAFPEVAEYRVLLDHKQSMLELSLQVELQPECPHGREVQARLEESFQTAFNLRVPITRVAAGSLPRFEMKAKRWLRVPAV